jgi:uncharacterized phage protein gp47/JayE
MPTYGLTDAGFVTKDLQTIKTELETSFKGIYGGDLDVSPESVAGQIIGNHSKKFADLWELLAAVHASFNPDSATGVSQDGGVALVNVKRIAATKSEVWVMLYGDIDSVIPINHQVSSTNGTIFKLFADTTISNTVAGDVQISLPNDLVIGQDYIVTINGTPFNYTALEGDTKVDIVQGIADLIDAGVVPVITDVLTDTLRITSDNGYTSFNITLSANLEFSVLSTPGKYLANTVGAIVVPANTINVIVQSVAGLDSVNNIIPGTTGLNRESDDELRVRRRSALFAHGYSTEESIRARILQEVSGVSFCKVISNRKDLPDGDGRPGHSIETIVMGGSNNEIAAKLWQVCPAGIAFHGGTTVVIQDSMEDNQTIKFSRPTLKYIWVRVTITLNPEETFPVTGGATIKNNIIAWVLSNITVGTNVIHQKLYTPVYNGVNGINSALVEIGVTDVPEVPPVVYSEANISIGSVELAYFDTSQIEVFTL